MPWAPGQSVTSGSIATNLDKLFVFGTVDAYKDLVSGTTYTGSLAGGAAFGTDAIGTYVETFTNGDYLQTGSLGQSVTDTDYSLFLTFSRSGTVPNFSQLFNQIESGGNYLYGLQCDSPPTTVRNYLNSGYVSISNDLSSITTNTEFTVVITKTGTTGKYFYKSGSSPISYTSGTFSGSKTLTIIEVGGWSSSGQIIYPGRFRAYGRWSRALSDAEAQSMANTPQQIITPVVAYTYARPASDITTQWTPSTGTSHYALINEVTPDDANYIYATAASQTDEVKLGPMTTPNAGTSVNINYRVQGIVVGASVTTSLYCNTTLIKADTARTTNGTYTMTVTSAEWASVADWTNMRIRFVSA